MKKVLICMCIFFLLLTMITLIINLYVKRTTKKQIKNEKELTSIKNVDCILVLGAGIWGNRPSNMLEDRLLTSISLYENNIEPKIIMSGDHTKEDYDEVNLMKQFAIDKGIPSEDIFMDHAGVSSYDSVYRAKEIFDVKKMVIVTQKYHLYRALYIANQLGIEAYGVEADIRKYPRQIYREFREILARNKDFFKCILKPQSTVLGEKIPITGNGDITNDKD